MYFDRLLPPRAGEVHALFDPDAQRYIIKRLDLKDGRWFMRSNLPNVWIRNQRIIGRLALSVHFDGWPLVDPDATAIANAENAEFERLVHARIAAAGGIHP